MRAAVGDDVPAGIALVSIGAVGRLSVRTGPPRPVVPGATVQVDVVLDSAADRDLVVAVDGDEVPVPAGGAGLRTVDAAGPITVTCGPARCTIDATVPAAAATLRLTSPHGARWSVTDATGGAWFADGVPAKWDADDRPFFHTDPGPVELRVPAGPLHVVAARGLEFARMEVDVAPAAGETVAVDYAPVRRFDPAADGWYGADLHVHLNYSGDHVLEPADAVRMQRGEGLALMHLARRQPRRRARLRPGAAGGDGGHGPARRRSAGALGAGVPQPAARARARAGPDRRPGAAVHRRARAPTTPGTGRPTAWPAARCATSAPSPPTRIPCSRRCDDTDDLFRPFRMVEARELVADAAIGVVDAVELVSCFDDRGALVLYHHLLSCGLRLAATAGTDTFLSFARGPAPASNPPGWGRVYAQLGDAPLSTDAFADAVRAGRTVVTNGPWLTLDVDGHGPGAVLDRGPGQRLRVRARAVGRAVSRSWWSTGRTG